MTKEEILRAWLSYAEYNPEQNRFNILSANYIYNRACKTIKKILSFDPSGAVAILYAKDAFLNVCKESKITVFDLFSAEAPLSDDRAMWDVFMSQDVQEIEKQLLDAINAVVEDVVHVKQIGERDMEQERKSLLDSVTSVSEQLTACRTELYMRGGPIQTIRNFSTKIHVFDRLADCLLAVEAAPDGMYLCYISCGGKAEGYFGFFIKSNGTILSVNERISEAYPGQHQMSRNGRHVEEKKFELFPYKFIFSFSDRDYLGYAHKHSIDESKLEFCQLEPAAYMPLILGMVMISNKLSGYDAKDLPIVLIDALFQQNLNKALPGSVDLAVVSKSAIAKPSLSYKPSFSSDDVVSGVLTKRFTDKSLPYDERGELPTEENIFVKLYGDGFELDTSKLLLSDQTLMLTSDEKPWVKDAVACNEFVGTQNKMDLIAYMQARAQLADYIRKRMAIEYNAFGGAKAVREWFKKAIQERKEQFYRLCVRKYHEVQNGCSAAPYDLYHPCHLNTPGLSYVYYYPDVPGGCPKGAAWSKYPFNECKPSRFQSFENLKQNSYPEKDISKKLCPITGSLSSVCFYFQPGTWEELEFLFGPVPKILRGWERKTVRDFGNPLLRVTDKCSEIGTLFEDDEQTKNPRVKNSKPWEKEQWSFPDEETIQDHPQTEFSFGIAFSKRGFAQLLKQYPEEKDLAWGANGERHDPKQDHIEIIAGA